MNSPEDIYQELYEALQMSGFWPDGKLIADLIPKTNPDKILLAYRQEKDRPGFNIKTFAEYYFDFPSKELQHFHTNPEYDVEQHIERLWAFLQREPDKIIPGSSLIPLNHNYIVPGGRFNEIYYWDSYFTMLGLAESGKWSLMRSMMENFKDMIYQFGFIPNGNRTYFLSRSQPPFFSLMVRLLAHHEGREVLQHYQEAMVREYDFWMRGTELTDKKGDAFERVVRFGKKQYLNRYYDNRMSPRAEMYRDDLATASKSRRPAGEIFLNIRAACESGWDFSSRWLQDAKQLETIRTAEIVPVDLNCLLVHLEETLADSFALSGHRDATWFGERSRERRKLLSKFYNPGLGYYCDWDLAAGGVNDKITLAGMYPLFFNIATKKQAENTVKVIETHLLADGGVRTSTEYSEQQWDAPNGWAPLQWITIQGLRNYGYLALADRIKSRWVALNLSVFKKTGKLLEKYNVENTDLSGGGGEYPVQDGFGWTNGVLLKLLKEA